MKKTKTSNLLVRKTGFVNWLKWVFKPSDNMMVFMIDNSTSIKVGDTVAVSNGQIEGMFKVICKV